MNTIIFFKQPYRGSWPGVLEGVSQFCRENSWMMLDVDQPTDSESVRNLIRDFQPVGCIVNHGLGGRPEVMKWIRGIPAVYLDSTSARLRPRLVHNQAAVARLAAQELLGLGLERYAYVPYFRDEGWSHERGTAFADCVRKARRRVSVFRKGSLRDFLLDIPRPFGVMAANDQTALRVMDTAMKAGIDIPRDMAIVGVDNNEAYCCNMRLGLTSVYTDRRRVGYKLAELLSMEIGKPGSAPSVSFYSPSSVVRRGSTRRMPQMSDRAVIEAVEFIHRNACSIAISVDAVARVMGCPRCVCTRRFRAATGRSILDEVHEVRFQRICELLGTTRMSISAAIDFSGYKSSAFAMRYFRKRTGQTMLKWRMSHADGQST